MTAFDPMAIPVKLTGQIQFMDGKQYSLFADYYDVEDAVLGLGKDMTNIMSVKFTVHTSNRQAASGELNLKERTCCIQPNPILNIENITLLSRYVIDVATYYAFRIIYMYYMGSIIYMKGEEPGADVIRFPWDAGTGDILANNGGVYRKPAPSIHAEMLQEYADKRNHTYPSSCITAKFVCLSLQVGEADTQGIILQSPLRNGCHLTSIKKQLDTYAPRIYHAVLSFGLNDDTWLHICFYGPERLITVGGCSYTPAGTKAWTNAHPEYSVLIQPLFEVERHMVWGGTIKRCKDPSRWLPTEYTLS